jgi:hypothetical protein
MNTINNANQKVEQYNEEAAEALLRALYGVREWQWQTRRTNMSDLLNGNQGQQQR